MTPGVTSRLKLSQFFRGRTATGGLSGNPNRIQTVKLALHSPAQRVLYRLLTTQGHCLDCSFAGLIGESVAQSLPNRLWS